VQVAALAALVAEKGNTNAVTDAGVAALLAHAACKGAAYNVRVNVQALDDKSKGAALTSEANRLVAQAASLAETTSSLVEKALSS
jgi:glutamate formiminotransferase/formiminotetrahydrofolate cyclodeaminase